MQFFIDPPDWMEILAMDGMQQSKDTDDWVRLVSEPDYLRPTGVAPLPPLEMSIGETNPNIAAAARGFFVPVWQSRFEQGAASRKLGDAWELTVCQYLDRLNEIGFVCKAFYHRMHKCAGNSALQLTAWRLGYATS